MTLSLDWKHTALLLVDPQQDLLSPEGAGWDLVGEQVTRRHTLQHMVQLRQAAEARGLPVLFSHIRVSSEDYAGWVSHNPLQALMAERKLMLAGGGAAFHPDLAPSSSTVLLSPRRGPSPSQSDLQDQLRERGIRTLIVAGMIANLCVESHVREATDAGIDAIVVGDAVATLSDEAHAATLANFGLLATGVTETRAVLDALADAQVSS